MESDIKPKKCGYKVHPPAVIMSYIIVSSGKTHRRTMPLRKFTKTSLPKQVAAELKCNPRHELYLRAVPTGLLEKLVTMIKDQLNGFSLEATISRNCAETIDPNEDLNKLGDEELNRKKAIMDKTFNKNRILPDDDRFQYDIQVDFSDDAIETNEWDSDNSGDDGF